MDLLTFFFYWKSKTNSAIGVYELFYKRVFGIFKYN